MKIFFRISALMLVLLIALSALSLVALAEDTTVTLNGFSFTINKSGEATIHGYDGRDSDVVIPQTLMGAKVIEIADYAFFGQTGLTSISFENADNLKRIGTSAFSGCTSIERVSLNSATEELGFGAFQLCSSLKELELNEKLSSVPAQCFYGCSSLETVTVPENCESIGERAFALNTSLKKAYVSPSTVNIAKNAFDGSDEAVVYCEYKSRAHLWAVENGVKFFCGYLLGDADGDGEVTVSDATCIQRVNAGITLTPTVYDELADIDSSGSLEITDATFILRYLVEIPIPFGVGKPVE